MQRKTRNLLIGIVVLALLALLGWVFSGPWRAMHGIRTALERGDVNALNAHVDFPTLKSNMKAQIEDRIARGIASRAGGSMPGAVLSQVGSEISDAAVDAMVSPAGIAVLLQGHALMQRAKGNVGPGATDGTVKPDPLAQAKTKFESPSRFTATVPSAEGHDVMFVFERQGLNWRLTDVVLPKL